MQTVAGRRRLAAVLVPTIAVGLLNALFMPTVCSGSSAGDGFSCSSLLLSGFWNGAGGDPLSKRNPIYVGGIVLDVIICAALIAWGIRTWRGASRQVSSD